MNMNVLNPNPLLPVLPFEFGERLKLLDEQLHQLHRTA